MKKIHIYKSLIVLCVILTIFGYARQFFILFLSVTFHEFSHICMAKIFGLKANKIIFTPLGDVAQIDGIEFLNKYQRIAILVAGPLFNIALGLLFLIFVKSNNYIILINFGLAFFNILPVFPLDGSRILQTFLEKSIGSLSSLEILFRIGNVTILIIIFLGLIQLILYPLNISLLCLGLYIFFINRQEHVNQYILLYRQLVFHKQNKILKRPLVIKSLFCPKDFEIKKVVKMLNFESFLIVYIDDKTGFISITENEILNYIRKFGMIGNVEDVARQ